LQVANLEAWTGADLMKEVIRKVTAVLLLFALPTLLGAAELQVEWDRVPKPLVEGRKLEVQLAGGAKLLGKAVAVRPEGLQMEIAKVSLKDNKYRRGVATVEKGDIVALKVRKPHVRGRILATVAGGAVAGTYSGMRAITSEGADVGPELTAISIAMVAGGYLLGRMLDRSDVTTIQILTTGQKPATR
jgi:hypothetical protein